MSHSNSTALERLPDGAIQLCQGRIHAFNRAAGTQFPELAVGDQPPAFLAPALAGSTWIAENRTFVLRIGAHWFYR